MKNNADEEGKTNWKKENQTGKKRKQEGLSKTPERTCTQQDLDMRFKRPGSEKGKREIKDFGGKKEFR